MKFFGRLKSFFCNQHKQNSTSGHLELLFRIREGIPDARVRVELLNQIEQWRYMTRQLRVETLKEEIPDEYIGTMDFLCEGKLIRRQYLKIQEVYVATMITSFH